ncbi:DNA-binding transcriptional regulator YafC [Providencia burhodogranariea]|uniref:LysR family transcriptional regulator n=1 Tax=Providencia burhodogranariea DSM 19968 TaxID=1141662 RepID=K8WN81_9GAMM|nr:DNA-binding transcriptional regulator YafC [Providencia burhodogranariea]EKT62024.1 LysR family transcriptional regulator [Providencia burhodogranariea DSM 19968]
MKSTSEEVQVFITVVECGSFSRAAEKLDVANSVVSRTVKKLEAKLGVNLLNRTTRQLSLTEEGDRYFHRMKVILQDMAAAENELIDTQNSPRGLLRIDAATPVVLHLLVPFIKEFSFTYPEITLSLVSSETFINLIDRKVDIAIRVGDLMDSSLRARPLFESYRKIVASPNYIAQHGKPESTEDLVNHTCLAFTEPALLNTWPVRDINEQQVMIESGISSNSGETIRQLCLAGNGIACLSDFMVNEDIEQGDFITLFSDKLQPIAMPFNAVYYSEKIVSQRIRVFIDSLSEYIKNKLK